MENNKANILTTTYGSVELEHHQVKTQDNYPLMLHRVKSSNHAQSTPVIFVHGAYSNRHFWLSPKGKGIARFFAESGIDVWLLETRGHGMSIDSSRYKTITVDESVQFDFSACSQYVKQMNPNPQIWIGHSYGGMYLTFSLSAGYLPKDNLLAFCTIGTQVIEGQAYLRFKPIAQTFKIATNLLGKFPAKLLKLGGEDEPPAISNQFIHWKSTGQYISSAGFNYLNALNSINLPHIALAGGADQIDPAPGCEVFFNLIGSDDKSFWLLEKAKGWQKDYGHVDMIVGKTAEAEVWPKLYDWVVNQSEVSSQESMKDKLEPEEA